MTDLDCLVVQYAAFRINSLDLLFSNRIGFYETDFDLFTDSLSLLISATLSFSKNSSIRITSDISA